MRNGRVVVHTHRREHPVFACVFGHHDGMAAISQVRDRDDTRMHGGYAEQQRQQHQPPADAGYSKR